MRNDANILPTRYYVAYADSKVRTLHEDASAKIVLNDHFFWKANAYEMVITTVHSKGAFDKNYVFSLSDDESLRMRNNIDGILISHVANHFGIPVQMNTVMKDFKGKK